MIDLEKQIEESDHSVNVPQQISGRYIYGAPVTALTDADNNTATGTYSTGTADIINNHTTRINEIEAALVKLKLLKP